MKSKLLYSILLKNQDRPECFLENVLFSEYLIALSTSGLIPNGFTHPYQLKRRPQEQIASRSTESHGLV